MKRTDFSLTGRHPDIVRFPKTTKGTDLMADSPVPVTPKQMCDLLLEVKTVKKE